MLKKMVLFAMLLLLMVISLGCPSNDKYKKVFDENGRLISQDFERITHIDRPSHLKLR